MQVRDDAIAVSLTKGMRVRKDGPQLISQMISSRLRVDCSVLMGANIASDIGREELSEATLGYTVPTHADLLTKLFSRPYFLVKPVPDVVCTSRHFGITAWAPTGHDVGKLHVVSCLPHDSQISCARSPAHVPVRRSLMGSRCGCMLWGDEAFIVEAVGWARSADGEGRRAQSRP